MTPGQRIRERRLEPILERGAEVGVLLDAVMTAREGTGSAITIVGEPGLGKTRLLDEVALSATTEGLEVLAAGGRELERDFSFGVVLQLLEGRIAAARPDERDRLFSGAARLARPLFGEGWGEPPHPSDAQRQSVLQALYWLVANLAERTPLALVVDDAQWADSATLRFLLYLSRRIDDLAVVLVLAIAKGERLRTSPLLQELEADDAGTVLRLYPLSPQGVLTYLNGTLFPGADPDFAAACHGATGGNPFYLRELAVELAVSEEPPTVEAISGFAPESVIRALLLRLDRIGPGAVALARAVAVLGDGAELRHAAALARLDQSDAVRLADALIDARVFARRDPLSFVHPIIRTAVYRERSAPDRADAHLRAARLLEGDGAPAEQVAGHLVKARRAGDPWAVETLVVAAGEALRRGAPDAAARLLRRALEEPPPAARRPRVLVELGHAEALAGDPGAVERLELARGQLDDPVERAAAALEIGRTLISRGRPGEAADAFARGLADLGEGGGPLRAQLEAAREGLRAAFPRQGPPAPLGDVRLDEVGADSAQGRALLARAAFDRAMSGTPANEVRALAVRALGRGALLEEETAEGIVYYLAVHALIAAGDLDAADAALDAAIDEARRRGSVLGFATASHFRALASLARGRLREATAHADNALAERGRGWSLAVPDALAVLAECQLERGDLAAAEETLERAAAVETAEAAPTAYRHLGVRAAVRLGQDRPREALGEAVELGRRLEGAGAANPAVHPWRSTAALALARLGDVARARRLADEEISLAGAFGAAWPLGRAFRVAAAVAEGRDSIPLLRQAVHILEDSAAELELAYALVDLGARLRRSRQRKAAREPLQRGRELAERCGAEALARRARTESLATGARRGRRAAHGPEALTAREREVAERAAEGLSNREIARSLFVTLKTVEWHLSQAYDKLGVRSRRELAEALRRPSS